MFPFATATLDAYEYLSMEVRKSMLLITRVRDDPFLPPLQQHLFWSSTDHPSTIPHLIPKVYLDTFPTLSNIYATCYAVSNYDIPNAIFSSFIRSKMFPAEVNLEQEKREFWKATARR